MGAQWTRRQVLSRSGAVAAGVAGLGLAGYAGHQWPHGKPAGSSSAGSSSGGSSSGGSTQATTAGGAADGTQQFVSEPGLSPPVLTMTYPSPRFPPGSGSGYIFVTPFGGSAQKGLMICDRLGRLVWFKPPAHGHKVMDFNVQSYRGKPVLTWWEGKVVHGIGYGKAYIGDSSYATAHTIQAGNGLQVDLHEFVITEQDTALVTSVRKQKADLRGVGGPAQGVVLSGVAQEIDIATGAVLFEWDSMKHVDVTETHKKFSGGTAKDPFDYFHINSIAVAPDGDLIISARNTWAVYKVARPSGEVSWRLGGKKSSFTMGPGTSFYWQHHARPHGAKLLSIFDDGAGPPAEEAQSRAIFVDLDTSAMHATLRKAYTHPASLLAVAMGSAELLPDGRLFVGWGTESYFSEFSPGGELILDGEFSKDILSYRAFCSPWTGRPSQRPAVAVRKGFAGGAAVYASWNGATEVANWTVLAGKTPSTLTSAGTQEWTGFETAINVTSAGPHFAVVALDAHGRKLGRSSTVKLGSG